MVAAFLLTGCIPTVGRHLPYATGNISGTVIDSSGRPVAGATVTAIYVSSWIQVIPPSSNQVVAAQTVTKDDGTFTITATERIEILAAHSDDFKMVGDLNGVKQNGNVIRISRPPRPPSPHP